MYIGVSGLIWNLIGLSMLRISHSFWTSSVIGLLTRVCQLWILLQKLEMPKLVLVEAWCIKWRATIHKSDAMSLFQDEYKIKPEMLWYFIDVLLYRWSGYGVSAASDTKLSPSITSSYNKLYWYSFSKRMLLQMNVPVCRHCIVKFLQIL